MREVTSLLCVLFLGGASLVACDKVRPVAGASALSGCVQCHGSPGTVPNMAGTDPDLDAAPPPPSDLAHPAHVNPAVAGALRGPLACNACHNPVPTSPLHFTHPAPLVVFGALAGTGQARPVYRAPTCAATYCHGTFSFSGGDPAQSGEVVGNAYTPDWTKGPSEAACGTCHDLPPKGHVALSPNLGPPFAAASCSGCHPSTVALDGSIVVDAATGASAHIDGQAEEGAHADPDWCVLASPFGTQAGCASAAPGAPAGGNHTVAALDFSAPGGGLPSCLACHSVGATPYGSADGQTTSSCNDCHASTGQASWLSNCTFCHGDASRTPILAGTDPLLDAAPPRGVEGESLPSQPAVGAHQAHVNPSSDTALTLPLACSACHNPFPPASPHPSGATALVAFGALARTGGAAPSYDPVMGCAATYCHGNYAPGGNNATPTWTGGSDQAACGTCHGLPPATGRVVSIGGPPFTLHVLHADVGLECGNCHPGYGFSNGPVNLALHVNGVVDTGANLTSYDPATGACVGCHGADHWF